MQVDTEAGESQWVAATVTAVLVDGWFAVRYVGFKPMTDVMRVTPYIEQRTRGDANLSLQ